MLYLGLMDSAKTIRITVDGFAEDIPARLSLAELLELRGESAKITLVEHNGTYVRATALGEIELAEGDKVVK